MPPEQWQRLGIVATSLSTGVKRGGAPRTTGHLLADVSAILGSLDIVFGEVDR